MNTHNFFFDHNLVKAIVRCIKMCLFVKIKKTETTFFFAFLLIGCSLFGSISDSLFVQANEKYKVGLYSESIQLYDSILKQGKHSAEIYYNMGNSYYHLNQNGRAIQYFEKAKKLNPNNPDIVHNLQLVTKNNVDVIEEIPPTVFESAKTFLFDWLHYENWALGSILFSFISLILFALYFFISKSSLKRLFFTSFLVSFFLFAFSWVGAAFQKSKTDEVREAIIVFVNSYVKVAPAEESKDAFILHEGTKVRLFDQVDQWVKIRLSDGKTGWINQEHIGII